MSKEYIEREAILNELKEELEMNTPMCTEEQNRYIDLGLKIAIKDIERFSNADVVEVVRCKDCIHYSPDNKSGLLHSPCNRVFALGICYEDSFCSYGKR